MMGQRDGGLTGRAFKGDADFLSGLKEAELVSVSPLATWSLYLMLALLCSVMVWANLSKVDTIVKSQGKVVPDGREQVIASLEGGIIQAVLVREGMLVERGQELLRLDPKRVEAQQNEGVAKYLAMLAQYSRLQAEASGRALAFPKELRNEASLIQAESEAFDARRDALSEALSIHRRNLTLLKRELNMAELMSSRGLMSDVEVMRLRRQVNDINLQIAERDNRFRQDARIELARVASEMAQLQEQLVVKRDVLERTTLTSPIRGLVKNIKLGTVGGVVAPGATVMEILPVGPRVLVEAKIKPADIGFVRIGMPAEVKLTTYDYYTYGGMHGTIEYISPDAISEPGGAAESQDGSYRALVRTDSTRLSSNGKPLSVIPGMTASVEIRTGQRSVIEFLLKPLLKYKEAFRER